MDANISLGARSEQISNTLDSLEKALDQGNWITTSLETRIKDGPVKRFFKGLANAFGGKYYTSINKTAVVQNLLNLVKAEDTLEPIKAELVTRVNDIANRLLQMGKKDSPHRAPIAAMQAQFDHIKISIYQKIELLSDYAVKDYKADPSEKSFLLSVKKLNFYSECAGNKVVEYRVKGSEIKTIDVPSCIRDLKIEEGGRQIKALKKTCLEAEPVPPEAELNPKIMFEKNENSILILEKWRDEARKYYDNQALPEGHSKKQDSASPFAYSFAGLRQLEEFLTEYSESNPDVLQSEIASLKKDLKIYEDSLVEYVKDHLKLVVNAAMSLDRSSASYDEKLKQVKADLGKVKSKYRELSDIKDQKVVEQIKVLEASADLYLM